MAESTALTEHVPDHRLSTEHLGWLDEVVPEDSTDDHDNPVYDAIVDTVERIVAARLTAARADERAKVAAAVLPLVEAVEDTYDECTPSRGCTGCELRLYAQRVRAALTTTQPQPTEIAGELWLLDGSGA